MDDFINDSIKYGAYFLVGLAILIVVPLFFGIFLAICAAAFTVGAIINAVVTLVRKLKWHRQESPSKPQS